MSKRKIDETMTQARIARAKKAKAGKVPAAEAQPAEAKTPDTAPADEPKATARRAGKEKAGPKESRGDLVVFAFRLTEKERDLIHKAAGPAKASRYVRTLAVAAARGDEAAVKEILHAASNPAV